MADCTCAATFDAEHTINCARYPNGGYPPFRLPAPTYTDVEVVVPLTPLQAVQVAKRHLANGATGPVSADIVAGVIADAELADECRRESDRAGMEVALQLTAAQADLRRLEAVIDRVRAFHKPDRWQGRCVHDDEVWPCPTAVLLPPTQPEETP